MNSAPTKTKITEIFKWKTETEITNGLWERERGERKGIRDCRKMESTERNKRRTYENGLAVRVGTMHILQLGSVAFFLSKDSALGCSHL